MVFHSWNLETFTETLQEIQAEMQESHFVSRGGTQEQLGRQVALRLALWKPKSASASATDSPARLSASHCFIVSHLNGLMSYLRSFVHLAPVLVSLAFFIY